MMLEFENVTKVYKDKFTAVQNIDLKIEKGSFSFIVGKSGAGKSTLIKLLIKEINPSEGRLFFDGEDITYLSSRKVPIHRRKIGVIFQDFRLLNRKTVYENIAFAMEMVGHSPKVIRREVPTVLSMVGLSDKANNFPNELAGGEQQRIAIARAVVNKPELIIADEPTGNLDPETTYEIMKIFTEINRRGTTLIMATHDRMIVDAMKKRVIELKNGKIIRDTQEGEYYNVY
ncbi:cell division ATP-binding protein FtsE [Dethiosulfatibacter aminovorans DSM 17477]|uniref:Cell division ATP-binding protein FtsE n=2 Tax=Dethiosulfatibacter TaxID=448125 RepID=A0A1M6DMQ3_9FIRM|nr:cell division ATP-binding protein FtsE [Dethiosulfatibacter aminovorans DSM 17477]